MESKIKNYSDISDDELVYMISENSQDAKDKMYEKYSAMIHKELNKVKKSAYALGIEWPDLMQEAMLGFSNAINSYDKDNEASFGTYATLCVKRKLINYIEKYATQKNFTMKKALSIDAELQDNKNDYIYFLKEIEGREPLNKVITAEELENTLEKLGSLLNKEEKEIMELSIAGKKPEEIANALSMPVKKVYNMLYRARKKIKNE